MGLLQDVVRVYRNEGLTEFLFEFAEFLQRSALFPLYKINNIYWNRKMGEATSVLQYDWDNLILMDACRYDKFIRICQFDRSLIDSRITLGSRTPEFLHRTFGGRTFHDTVYITANPQVLKFEAENSREKPTFHSIISLLDCWDSSTQTIPPNEVHKAALEAQRNYPNKKLIIHYLQPHAPFIGKKATEIRERTGKTIGGLDPGRDYTDVGRKDIETLTYREAIADGEIKINQEDIITAYQETLSLTIDEIEDNVESLKGRTLLTSDHGELLGERVFPFVSPLWEHPRSIRSPEVCKVPMVEFKSSCRKSVISEIPKDSHNIDENIVDNRLKSLGYK